MTAEHHTAMREDLAAERIRKGAEAFERIRGGNHWRDWTEVAQALDAMRSLAMAEAYTNQPAGRRYNAAFGQQLDRHPWARKLHTTTRNHCFWVADHLVEIERWRDTLGANQRDEWNHPSVIKRQYERVMREQAIKAEGRPEKSPMAQLKESLVVIETERDRWRRQAEEAGSLFDLRRDTPEQIAKVLVESVTPSRAEKIAAAIRAELKRHKAAHAG